MGSKRSRGIIESHKHSTPEISVNLSKTKVLVERPSIFVNRINSDNAGGSVSTRRYGVPKSIDQQVTTVSLAMEPYIDCEPGQENHADLIVREVSSQSSGEFVMADAAHRERVVPDDIIVIVCQDEGSRKVTTLILEGVALEPVVQKLNPAIERPKFVARAEPLDSH